MERGYFETMFHKFHSLSFFSDKRAEKKRRYVGNPAAKIMRTKACVQYVLREHKATFPDVKKVFSVPGRSAETPTRWIKGQHSMGRVKLKQLEDEYSGVRKIYDHPLFKLLEDTQLEKSEMIREISGYRDFQFGAEWWTFPATQNDSPRGLPTNPMIHISNVDGLFQRGDLYGFMGLLYLTRLAEIEGDTLMHIVYAKELYRALPGACRYPLFKPHWKSMLEAVNAVVMRVPTTPLILEAKPREIEKQIQAKVHGAHLLERGRNCYGFMIEPELTYREATF